MPELTPSTREAARRIGITETALREAASAGRIVREPDGQWDIDKTRRRLVETADPTPSPLAGSATADGTPFARLKVAQLALKVDAQRLALDESKRRLIDVAEADATIDEVAGAMRDALLNWPARIAGVIAAELGVDPHLLQTILQQHVAELLTETADRFDPPGIGGDRNMSGITLMSARAAGPIRNTTPRPRRIQSVQPPRLDDLDVC